MRKDLTLTSESRSSRTDLIAVLVLWLVLTAVGIAALFAVDLQPLAAAKQAEEIDDTFFQLMVLAMPIFAGVVAVLLYSVIRFRASDTDGDAMEAMGHVGFGVEVPEGETVRVTFTVPDDASGEIEFGCFEDDGAHWDDGMKGSFTIVES